MRALSVYFYFDLVAMVADLSSDIIPRPSAKIAHLHAFLYPTIVH